MSKRFTLKTLAAAAATVVTLGTSVLTAGAVHAQADAIKVALVVEMSGAGATSGTNFRDGALMAIKEINEAGGIMGKKIVTTAGDTQTNPGVAKGLTQKAIDDGAFAIFGPVFSGSIMVSIAPR
jgi:branched-chain amino acid transport system substrate-binding protein